MTPRMTRAWLDRAPSDTQARRWTPGSPGHLSDKPSREDAMTQARRTLFGRCNCCTPTISRRNLLAGGAAVLAASAFAASGLKAQAKPHRIDVHHHISPPTWLDAVKKANLANPPLANWSVAKSLDDMDKAGIATAMCSPTTPQLTFLGNDKETAARLARESNEYTKKIMADHPGRFGLFAMLPLPHIDESLKEIAFAFDTLQADGVGQINN